MYILHGTLCYQIKPAMLWLVSRLSMHKNQCVSTQNDPELWISLLHQKKKVS